jgi:tRNA U34 2-thiouridine synthase MnmA/TrmU
VVINRSDETCTVNVLNNFRNDVFDNFINKFKDEVYVNLISFCFHPHHDF